MTTEFTTFLTQQGAQEITDQGPARWAFQAETQEAALLDSAVLMVPLTQYGLIRATGEEAAPFLHNLLSNDVKKLGTGQARRASFNTPKGRMLATLLLWRDDNDYLIQLTSDIHAPMLKKLSMYVLRSKVKLSDASQTVQLGIVGREASQRLTAAGFTVPADALHTSTQNGVQLIRLENALPEQAVERLILTTSVEQLPEVWQTLKAAGVLPAGQNAWDLAEIRAGIPRVTAATQESFVAQMTNYELIGGVSFTKGCYPGQEIVARTQHIGKVKRRMFRALLDQATFPHAGTALFSPDTGEQATGELVLAALNADNRYETLAVMHISSAVAGDVRVGDASGPALEISALPYAVNLD